MHESTTESKMSRLAESCLICAYRTEVQQDGMLCIHTDSSIQMSSTLILQDGTGFKRTSYPTRRSDWQYGTSITPRALNTIHGTVESVTAKICSNKCIAYLMVFRKRTMHIVRADGFPQAYHAYCKSQSKLKLCKLHKARLMWLPSIKVLPYHGTLS